MKMIATIEARMTSINGIVLATTINTSDDQLEGLSRKLGIGCYRGSENDVTLHIRNHPEILSQLYLVVPAETH